MKGIALEFIFKLMIVFIAAIVAISMIISYSDQIRTYLNSIMHKNEKFGAEKIVSINFTTSQVRTYIIACWDRYKKFTQEMICYVLLGDVTNVNSNILINSLDPPNLVDVSKFDISKNITIIRRISNGVMVES